MVFPDSSVGKESACSAGDPGMFPVLGRSAREGIGDPLQYSWASLVAQLVKNLPAMREAWVQSLVWEDPPEKGKAIHSVFWPGEFHGPYSPWGRKESDMTEQLSLGSQHNSISMLLGSSCPQGTSCVYSFVRLVKNICRILEITGHSV